jgi:hypothetical protein
MLGKVWQRLADAISFLAHVLSSCVAPGQMKFSESVLYESRLIRDDDFQAFINGIEGIKTFRPRSWRAIRLVFQLCSWRAISTSRRMGLGETEGQHLTSNGIQVYILRLADDQLYVGSTNNLPRRLAEHRTGNQESENLARSN